MTAPFLPRPRSRRAAGSGNWGWGLSVIRPGDPPFPRFAQPLPFRRPQAPPREKSGLSYRTGRSIIALYLFREMTDPFPLSLPAGREMEKLFHS